MKNVSLQIIVLSFSLAACQPKLKFQKVAFTTAQADVKKFRNEYPDYVLHGKDTIPVGPYHTVYAVKFDKYPDELKKHFPNLDFSEIKKIYPDSSTGIRIYQAISENKERKHSGSVLVNYATFTKPSSTPGGLDNDILDTDTALCKVYKIENYHIDLRGFRQMRGSKPTTNTDGLTRHLSCAPNCPEVSLFTKKNN